MRLTEIRKLCKASRRIQIYNCLEQQYIGDGYSIFPIQGLPYMQRDNIFSLLEIDNEDQYKYIYTETDGVPKNMNPIDEQEIKPTILQLHIIVDGYEVLPLCYEEGVIFLNVRYRNVIDKGVHYSYYIRNHDDITLIVFKENDYDTILGAVTPCRVIGAKYMSNICYLNRMSNLARDNDLFLAADKQEQIDVLNSEAEYDKE